MAKKEREPRLSVEESKEVLSHVERILDHAAKAVTVVARAFGQSKPKPKN